MFVFWFQEIHIGWGNGFAPNRRQAITWANDGPVPCHMSPGLSVLIDKIGTSEILLQNFVIPFHSFGWIGFP